MVLLDGGGVLGGCRGDYGAYSVADSTHLCTSAEWTATTARVPYEVFGEGAADNGCMIPPRPGGPDLSGQRRGLFPLPLTVVVIGWVVLTLLLLLGAFVLVALIYGRGDLPDNKTRPDWAFEVTRAAVPLAAVVGGAVAVAVGIRRQSSTEASHQLALEQSERERESTAANLKLALERSERERVSGLRDRFTTAAEQLAHEKAAIRLAGVYALAALADEWHEVGEYRETQVCIDLLCAYQRTPRPKTGKLVGNVVGVPELAETEVRTTISSVVGSHLRRGDPEQSARWERYDFNFKGAVFDAGHHDLSGVSVGGTLDFSGVKMRGQVFLDLVGLCLRAGGRIRFTNAELDDDGRLFIREAMVSEDTELWLNHVKVTEGATVDLTQTDVEAGGVVDLTMSIAGDRGAFMWGKAKISGGIVRASGFRADGGTVGVGASIIEDKSVIIFDGARINSGGNVMVSAERIAFGSTVRLGGAIVKEGGSLHVNRGDIEDGARVDTVPSVVRHPGGQVTYGYEPQ